MSGIDATCRPGRRAFGALVLALVSATGLVPKAFAGAAEEGDWTFRVLLDDKPIGEHRFQVRTTAGETRVTSDARFDVSFLGLTAYRYRHRSIESWRAGCLVLLTASTDDDGTPSQVRWQPQGERLAIGVAAGVEAVDGCLMSFAYWHPALRTQTRLLNAQTGKVESVRIVRLPETRLPVRGRTVAAAGLRVTGETRPVDVWYSAEGDWVGLDAVVDGGRRLSYRLP